jgi:hypothetical protein
MTFTITIVGILCAMGWWLYSKVIKLPLIHVIEMFVYWLLLTVSVALTLAELILLVMFFQQNNVL